MAFIFDGFSTTIGFSLDPSILLKEKTVTPPGWDGGGPNDTTNMRNTSLRTRQPKKLITLTDISASVFYDPILYESILNMINIIQSITVNFPDGSSLVFLGWLDKFMPQEAKEGEPPQATITVCPSNQTAAGVESLPVFLTA